MFLCVIKFANVNMHLVLCVWIIKSWTISLKSKVKQPTFRQIDSHTATHNQLTEACWITGLQACQSWHNDPRIFYWICITRNSKFQNPTHKHLRIDPHPNPFCQSGPVAERGDAPYFQWGNGHSGLLIHLPVGDISEWMRHYIKDEAENKNPILRWP